MAVIDLPVRLTAAAAARPPRAAVDAADGVVRAYWAVLAVLGVVAFVLNVENRLTSAGLFFFTPPLDLIPPLSPARWAQAYSAHQQDPVFAACGGSESLDEFQLLYLWNWFARASALLFAAAAVAGGATAIVVPRLRGALPRLAALLLLGVVYLAAGAATSFAVAHVADLGRYNVGQYRHAVDVLFATAALAIVLVALARAGPSRRVAWPAVVLLAGILLDVAFGAMFASRNAAAVWTTWPGYEGHLLPPPDQLVSFSPLWLNLTVNQYTLQFVHRALSMALWLGALAWLLATVVRRDPPQVRPALALLLLLSAQMAAGIAALVSGTPPT
jgi:heme A synthase